MNRFLAFDAAAPAPTIAKPAELTWWDWAVFLLHTAAEIEHALMVQYLYAAYSLASRDFEGTNVPADAALRTAAWRRTLTSIAKEEMGHLLTEQNLLRFIGGPVTLDRQDFPIRSALYPFPLSLRPLTRTTLATYVAAEMPADPAEPDIAEIVARATKAEGGMAVNRVGVLFDTLVDIFSDDTKLTDEDLRGPTAADQATAADWRPFDRLIVRTVTTRADAVDALRAIGEQGRGSVDAPSSHFAQFLDLYRAFPETESDGEPEWVPTASVPIDPSTAPRAASDPAVERGRITQPTTLLWAQLGNVRYRMLLHDLAHTLHLSGPFTGPDGPTVRGRLVEDAFAQMTGRFAAGLRGIARKLTTLPLKEHPEPGDPAHAGPPFELPYTLAVADDEHGRWRMHLALLDTSADLATRLRLAGEAGPLLDELDVVDTDWRTFVEAQLAAT